MTNEEELKLKREENKKLDEEADRLFFVRLGRFALVVNILTAYLILPGFAAWRALEIHFDSASSKPFFWNNLGWLLLRDLYALGALVIIYSVIYLVGGTRGWRLCGAPDIFSASPTDEKFEFWLFVFLLIFPYVFFVFMGIGCIDLYKFWIK